ncbi:hypothetical protein [Thaumasiovibrio sp. DFM-14]|uniref:hypothetical protein n=1 Tax=Thaumasiovibrio sp. DFM-14 TaxID=3384792 RepID=UPI0039A0CE1C
MKTIEMQAVPRTGEFLKFRNDVVGDYFSFKVTEVVYRETGSKIEISTELLDNVDNRGYSFEDESEFDEYLSSYLSVGWLSPRGVTENNYIR